MDAARLLVSLFAAAGVALCASAQGAGTPGAPAKGQDGWWQYRGDRRLSGRSLLRGRIERPVIEWSHPLAGRETLLAAALEKGPAEVPLPAGDAEAPAGQAWEQAMKEWRAPETGAVSWYDLDGNGQLAGVARSANQKVGKVLPNQPGLQLIETEPKGYPQLPDVLKGTVRLKVREQGRWVTRWETEIDSLIWQAEPLFGDFDGDGQNEIALLPWYRMYVLDAATGKVKEQASFLAADGSEMPGSGGRAYGWFGALDLDGDGRTEFVIIDDFIRFAAVLGRRGGKLQRLWIKVWQAPGKGGDFPEASETVVLRVNPEPVQDLDGDGRKEIVLGAFNTTGDGRWHTLALDGLTGAPKHDLPGQFLSGARDADGDGAPELFCTAVERGLHVPAPADLSLYAFTGGSPARKWTLPDASFVTHDIGQFPPHVNSGASLATETVLCAPAAADQPPLFFTRRSRPEGSGATELSCWQAGKRGFRRRAAWTGPDLAPLVVRRGAPGAPGILLRASAFDGEAARLRCPGGRARTKVVATRKVPAPVAPVVVGRPDPSSPPVVVAQGANETVEVFRPAAVARSHRIWRVPGRGMTSANYYEGLLLADLTGDSHLSVVVARRGKEDCARLAALALRDGKPLWSHDFPEFPGAPPPWNVPGLIYWQGGHFRDPQRMDLLVQLRRVGGESYLLDGRSGEVQWRQAKGRPGREFGRGWMLMYDFDGDRLEDALLLFPDQLAVARGRDGKLLLAEESLKFVGVPAYWSEALAADLLGRGRPQLLYSNEAVTALLTAQGEQIWKFEHPHPQTWRVPFGCGDADGDGSLEVFFPGAVGSRGREFQCRDAATGALKWSVPLPDEPFTFPAVADLNGDGRDECVFTIGGTVYAVGADRTGKGSVLWTLDLPARAGPVTIADVTGDGTARIVVSCADGRVYGLGAARP